LTVYSVLVAAHKSEFEYRFYNILSRLSHCYCHCMGCICYMQQSSASSACVYVVQGCLNSRLPWS